jgi:hypothetical protein
MPEAGGSNSRRRPLHEPSFQDGIHAHANHPALRTGLG